MLLMEVVPGHSLFDQLLIAVMDNRATCSVGDVIYLATCSVWQLLKEILFCINPGLHIPVLTSMYTYVLAYERPCVDIFQSPFESLPFTFIMKLAWADLSPCR